MKSKKRFLNSIMSSDQSTGSSGMIVMDENTCMVDIAKYFLTFLEGESCGNYWAPEKQLDYIAKQSNLAPEVFDVCPNCWD